MRIKIFVLGSWVAVVAFSCMLLALGQLGAMLMVKSLNEDGRRGGMMGEGAEKHQVQRHDLAHGSGPDIADRTTESAGNRSGGGEVEDFSKTVATNRFMGQKETLAGGSAFSEGERVLSATSDQAGGQVERRQHGNVVQRVEENSTLDAAQKGESHVAPQSVRTDASTTGQVARSESISPEAPDRGASQKAASAQAGGQVERRQHGNVIRRVEERSTPDAAQKGESHMVPQSVRTDASTAGQVARPESISPEAPDRGAAQKAALPSGQRPGEAERTE